MIGSRPGGVKIPSERMPAMISRHLPRSHGVKPHASAGVKVSGESGAGMRRIRLRRREHVARNAALRRGPLLDRIERFAGRAIEQEEATHLGDLRDARRGRRRRRRSGRAPAARARRSPSDRGGRSGNASARRRCRRRARPPSSSRSRGRGARRRSSRARRCRWARRRDRARRRPRGSTTRWACPPCTSRPRSRCTFARHSGRNRIEGPAQRAGAHVEGAHHAGRRVGAHVVRDQRADDDHVADHQRRRRDVVLPGRHVAEPFAQRDAAVRCRSRCTGCRSRRRARSAPSRSSR